VVASESTSLVPDHPALRAPLLLQEGSLLTRFESFRSLICRVRPLVDVKALSATLRALFAPHHISSVHNTDIIYGVVPIVLL
jgi:hypothetical protein